MNATGNQEINSVFWRPVQMFEGTGPYAVMIDSKAVPKTTEMKVLI